ncbi:hypothetical protein [Microscilla marina]|uniref:Uncharacterized protein n=1 Tax=Microscilla marina ATCC 23134 TaxID=313606 RepID=A1ZNG8_MICM2|nr:hypothetical protein [Microscilla marina]EAY28079.1 hypothetical protein M23134_02189 [Microscilla marina ATCC 23134]
MKVNKKNKCETVLYACGFLRKKARQELMAMMMRQMMGVVMDVSGG